MHLLLAIVIANVVVFLTDWYFFGVLWHDKYLAFPEVWRRPQGAPEGTAVAVSALVGTLTPTVFVILCALLILVRPGQVALVGAAVFLMTAVPLLAWNYVFMKVHPLTFLGQLLGWLVRLGLSAAVVVLLLG